MSVSYDKKKYLVTNGRFDPRAALVWLSQLLLLGVSLHLVISTFFVKTNCCFLNSFILFDLGPLLKNLFHMSPLTWFYLSEQLLSRLKPWKDLFGSTLSSPLFILNSPFGWLVPIFFFFHYKQTWPLHPFLLYTQNIIKPKALVGLGLCQ